MTVQPKGKSPMGWDCTYCHNRFFDKRNYIIHILEHHVELRGPLNLG